MAVLLNAAQISWPVEYNQKRVAAVTEEFSNLALWQNALWAMTSGTAAWSIDYDTAARRL